MPRASGESISFVMQGPFADGDDFDSNDAILALKQIFPKSEVIVSTWIGEGAKFSGMDFLVESNDPGVPSVGEFKVCSINRQLVSSYAGLKLASRKYAVKMRSDCKLASNNIEGLLRSEAQGRFVIIEYSSVNPIAGYHRLNFNLCDWLIGGEAEDVRTLFKRSLVPNAELMYWVNKPKPWLHSLPECAEKFQAEQYIWMWYYKERYSLRMAHGFDFHVRDCMRFLDFASEYCYIASVSELKLDCSKHPSLHWPDKTRLTQDDLNVWKCVRSGQVLSGLRYPRSLVRILIGVIFFVPRQLNRWLRARRGA